LRHDAGHANTMSERARDRRGRRLKASVKETIMAKAYWVSTYFSVSNPEAMAEYAKLAGPALAAAGAKFLARGNAVKAYEKGLTERCVIIEFDSVAQAIAAHDGPGYQAALKALGNGAQRDIRIVEGL
jgi:uncharacterized protein (DUF1330 family)